MQRSWALPKPCHLLAGRPRAAEDGLRLAHQSDVINIRLTGDLAVPTDTGSALKTGADVGGLTWPEDVFGQLDLDVSMLPHLVLPGTVIGQVCAEAAEETGLALGTAVVAGTTDGCAAQLASGATAVGSWNSVLGTTLVLKGVSGTLIHDPHGVVYSHRSPTGHWLPGGASGTGAGLIASEFGADLDRLTREAQPLLPTGLLRYPLVSPGERFPFVAPEARAFATAEPASDAEAFAALLQGVSYVERLCFDYVDLLGAPVDGPVHLTGGAARNPVWNQLRADVLGRPVALPGNAEPALGAAVLAAAGHSPLDAVSAAMVRVDTTLEPRASTRDRHLDGYLRLTGLFAERGWLPGAVAAHARERAGR
jgi:sugar (pentulose or hexulose) kinase